MSAKVGNHKSTVCFQCGVQQSLVIAANRGLCAVNVGIGSLIINNGTFILKQAIPLTYCSVISVLHVFLSPRHGAEVEDGHQVWWLAAKVWNWHSRASD
jgi:hypothetical protein